MTSFTRVSLLVPLAIGGTCFGAFTNFDSETEGFKGHPYTIDGITFTQNWGATFGIERADGTVGGFAGLPGFSVPNVLSIGVVRAGPEVGGGAVTTELTIDCGQQGTAASLDFFYGGYAGNTVTLEAVLDGAVVDAFHVLMTDHSDPPFGAVHMSVSSPAFDFVRLVSAGPVALGEFVGWLDNVRIVTVPGPGVLAVMAGAGGGVLRRRR